MSKSFREDLTGQRFGRLTVIEFVPNDKPHSYWKCKCDCGNIVTIGASQLKREITKSCGCFKKEKAKTENTVHGMSKTRIYSIWESMKKRCYNSNAQHYNDYGGRGITVCDEWKNDFKAFYDWAIANGYYDELTIDRIDANGNYEPSNCRWVDMKTQQRNKRNNVIVENKGRKMCLSEFSQIQNIPLSTLYRRCKCGDTGKQLIRSTDRRKVFTEYDGNMVDLHKLSELTGISIDTLYTRYYRGHRGEKLFRPVSKKKNK